MFNHTEVLKLMGNRFEFTAVAQSKSAAFFAVEVGINEVRRIENLLTTFNETSVTAQINEYAGIKPVQVPAEVFELIFRASKISDITQGAFDITYGSIDKKYWNFDTHMETLPDIKKAKKAVRLIDYNKVILKRKEQTVFLQNKGMRLGFGGIGKGYAADKAKMVMEENGACCGVVNAAGDLTAWGTQKDGSPWTIGIADPNAKNALFSKFEINNMSVATSGNYEKFAIINGRKYSHTINPRTGMPAHGIKSATVICQSGELADALTTPLIVMGIEAGLHMINQLSGIEAIIIDDKNRLFHSKNINLL